MLEQPLLSGCFWSHSLFIHNMPPEPCVCPYHFSILFLRVCPMPQSVGYIWSITKRRRIDACAGIRRALARGWLPRKIFISSSELCGRRIVGRYFYFSYGHVRDFLHLSNQIGRIMHVSFDAEAFKFADLNFFHVSITPTGEEWWGIQPESNFRPGPPFVRSPLGLMV